jgi:PAS domain S-box-containing protein
MHDPSDKTAVKVLAIDDRQENLDLIAACLQDNLPGTTVLCAGSGLEGIELAAREDPDVILLDIVMPGMDGFEVCRRLKEDEHLRAIPVLLLSAFETEEESRVRALDIGSDGVLCVPWKQSELIALVRSRAKTRASQRAQQQAREQYAAQLQRWSFDLEEQISKQKITDEALRHRSEELGALLDALPVMVWIGLDPECRIIIGNRTANEFTGTTAGTNVSQSAVASGNAVYLKVLKEDGSEFNPEELPMQQSIKLSRPVRGAILTFCFPNGRTLRTLGNAAPLFNEDGSPRGAVAAFLDISAREKAEEELRFARFTMNQMSEAVIWVTSEGKVDYVNDAHCRMHGYTREEMLCLSIEDITPFFQQNSWSEHWRKLKQKGSLVFESEGLTKSGELICVEVSAKHVMMGGREYDLGIVRDITFKKQSQEMIRQQLDELQRWQNVMLGREDRIGELKSEVNELSRRLGEPPRYSSRETTPALVRKDEAAP